MIQNYNNTVEYDMGAKKENMIYLDTMLISRLTLAIEPTPSSPFHHEKSCPQKWSDQPRLTS